MPTKGINGEDVRENDYYDIYNIHCVLVVTICT